jgi:hypothetical protein
MTHYIKAYPLGNADSTLFKLSSGKNILFDYAAMKTEEVNDGRCDLAAELNKDVEADFFDVVGFTHADMDHVKGFADYFYLQHATKYQAGNRKKINDLWVPAQVILEEGCEDETKILRAEARYRLRNKKDIKVFSKPGKLKDWLSKEGIPFDDVKHLIVDAGQMVPGWDDSNDEVAFFAHAPFALSSNGEDINRNNACLIIQATFTNIPQTQFLLLADADWQLLHEIVVLTERFENQYRLAWDIIHISHHCSYLSLSPEKGKEVTHPVEPVKRLFEEYGKEKCILISPSWIIPDLCEDVQPPHRQAFNYYKAVAENKSGEIMVTMEFPDKIHPAPIEISVNNYGATILKTIIPQGFASDRQPPKAG